MSVKFSVDVYPEYDAYVRIRPSVLIDLSTARRKEETGGRGRERAPLDLFSRTLSRRISAFYIRVVAIGREKFTFLFRSIRGICVIEAQKRSIFTNYREIVRRGEGRDREEDEARITSIFTFSPRTIRYIIPILPLVESNVELLRGIDACYCVFPSYA